MQLLCYIYFIEFQLFNIFYIKSYLTDYLLIDNLRNISYLEISFKKTFLNSPSAINFVGSMINETGGSEWTYFLTPIGQIDSYDANFTKYFGFPLVDGIIPNNTKYVAPTAAPVNLIATGGTLVDYYLTLADAFAAINAGTHTGAITINIVGNTTETTTAALYQSGYNSTSSYTSINIYPTVTGLTISGNLDAPLIDLNGADNVTFDGRVNATGSSKDLIISNASTSNADETSTIRFINDASNNTVKYCNVKGSSTVLNNGGIIYLSSATGTGNNYITIDNCDITQAGTNRPLHAISSIGTSGKENSHFTVSNCNIYNFLNPDGPFGSYGIFTLNSTDCSIINNSFYETVPFSPTTGKLISAITISNGWNHAVSGNYIGGTSPLCGGDALEKTNSNDNWFYGIYVYETSTPASSIQGNIIKNISWSNNGNADFYGIYILNALVNIGTTSPNIIGDVATTGSITVTNQLKDGVFSGIALYNAAHNSVISNNTIVSITTDGLAFCGILEDGTDPITFSNNTVGSVSGTNSINASSTYFNEGQLVVGIWSSNKTSIINGNNISYLNNACTHAESRCFGILTNALTVSNNTIRNLSNEGGTSTGDMASVVGISFKDPSGNNHTVSQNTIYNLSNSSTSTDIIGIYIETPGATNTVERNFIHSFTSTATAPIFTGIYCIDGTTTYKNNIISIAPSTAVSEINGINDVVGTNSIYFNTIYIGGTGSTETTNAILSSGNNVRDYRNNIFSNTRTGGTANSVNIISTDNLTIGYNDYEGNITSITIDANSITTSPNFAVAGGTVATNYRPGSYSNGVSIAEVTNDYANTTRLAIPSLGAFESIIGVVEVWSGTTFLATYPTLKAAFDKINDGTHNTGDLTIKITGSTTETETATLYQSGYGGVSNYTSINIYPNATGLTISGNLDAPLIDLNGADNVTFDGRVNSTGSSKDLIISNASTSSTDETSTIRFINDASNNTVKYCNVKGSSTAALNGGIIYISTTTGTTGNNNITIDNCDITQAGTNRPLQAISSNGTSGKENRNFTVSNCNIYDFLNPSNNSHGIYTINSTDCTVANNSFYETAPFSPITGDYFVVIFISDGGGGHTVSGNYIGGKAPLCGGTALVKTNSNNSQFYGILFNGNFTSTSNIQGNIIKNIHWSNSGNASFNGIAISFALVNVGTTSPNIIGDVATTESITVTNTTATSGAFYGIYVLVAPNSVISNNTIGSITTDGLDFYGINEYGTDQITFSNNTVGSLSVPNSINVSSTNFIGGQQVIGILSDNNTSIINGNNIGYINNACTNVDSRCYGINASALTVSNNTIRNLSNAGGTGITFGASVTGIYATFCINSDISQNTIYNLSHSGTATDIIGIYIESPDPLITNTIERNFIHSFTSTATAPVFTGIYCMEGTTTYKNNIISISPSTAVSTINGINDAAGTNSIYFNTIYIGGSGSTETTNALLSTGTNTRNYRNNIFVNTRTGGTSNAVTISSSSGLTIGYNDYVGTLSGITIDANSITTNPAFTNSIVATDYKPTFFRNGIAISGITTDYSNITRFTTPTIGAFEVLFPEINILGNGVSIVAGDNSPSTTDHTDFGNVAVGSSFVRTYTIENLETGVLTISAIAIGGANLGLFTVGGITLPTTVGASSSKTFTVTYAPLTTGTHNATVTITNDDANEGTYDFAVTGLATVSSTIWQVGEVWSNGAPTASMDAIIDYLYNETGAGANIICNNLTINSGKNLEIQPTYNVTVNGNLINNGNVILKSPASPIMTASGSLITYGTITNNTGATMLAERSVIPNRYHLMASPLAASVPAINPFFMDYVWTYLEGYNWTLPGNDNDYCWAQLPTQGATVDPKVGYLVKSTSTYNSNFVIPFAGTFNTGAVSFSTLPTAYQGYNLVANPYPSAIDWNAASGWTKTGIDGTTWIWVSNGVTEYSGAYATWNGTTGVNGGSQFIPAMQGFFVKASAGNNFAMNNNVRVHSTESFKSTIYDLVKLTVSGNLMNDEIALYFADDNEDSEKFMSWTENLPQIYSIENEKKLAINKLQNVKSEQTVDLGLTCDIDGNYTITANEYTFGISTSVELEDTKTGTFTTLSEGKSYSFDYSTTDDETRFVLHFNSSTVNISEPESNIEIYSSGQSIYINGISTSVEKVEIYNVIGQKVLTSELKPVIETNLFTGVYFVRIETNSQVISKKVFIQ